ncbi:WW/Rsp5/WWP domain protein [Akanthomyces lecanii RCEF 1005]|uniref:WW/Rsp5/WWP domain protein n=1 Tax=Akanthomyces lecanii RCEF 1005 TaxID=1081108 RepID=A0A168G7I3_CORDF|nr:WW/Rsp5/WWP domain protein [Akanthomyces lecanii RCEF 1005]
MDGTSLLSYLPPGWTEATYQNATSREYNALPEEQLEKLMGRKVEKARQEANRILEAARTWRATHGIATLAVDGTDRRPAAAAAAAPGPVDDVSLHNMQRLVQHAEASQWAEIGFLVFRTYYADEALWEHFQRRFGEVVDGGIVTAPTEAGLTRISSRVKLPLVSDYALVDLGPGGVAHIYRDSISNLDGDSEDEEDEVEEAEGDDEGHLASLDPGLRMPMCIMVDEECLQSMCEDGADALPFVKAVDVKLTTNKDLHYSGSFKVSARALISHFYAALQFYEPIDISNAVDKSTGVWTAMGNVQTSREGTEEQKVHRRHDK